MLARRGGAAMGMDWLRGLVGATDQMVPAGQPYAGAPGAQPWGQPYGAPPPGAAPPQDAPPAFGAPGAGPRWVAWGREHPRRGEPRPRHGARRRLPGVLRPLR